jgi:hypothetical protein
MTNAKKCSPRKWNAEFIEVPVVDSSAQHRPTFAADNISLMLNNEYRKEVARSVGLGFTIPAVVVQTVQRFEKSVEEKIAVTV